MATFFHGERHSPHSARMAHWGEILLEDEVITERGSATLEGIVVSKETHARLFGQKEVINEAEVLGRYTKRGSLSIWNHVIGRG